MKHRGRWIAATDAEAQALFTTIRTTARNPFNGKLVATEFLDTLDETALFAWPDAVDASLGYGRELALFEHDGAPFAASAGESNLAAYRMSPERVAAIAAMNGAEPWRALLRSKYPKAPAELAASISDAYADEVNRLARRAVERGGTVWGFFITDEED